MRESGRVGCWSAPVDGVEDVCGAMLRSLLRSAVEVKADKVPRTEVLVEGAGYGVNVETQGDRQ